MTGEKKRVRVVCWCQENALLQLLHWSSMCWAIAVELILLLVWYKLFTYINDRISSSGKFLVVYCEFPVWTYTYPLRGSFTFTYFLNFNVAQVSRLQLWWERSVPGCNFGLNRIRQSLQMEILRMNLDVHSQICILEERKVRTDTLVSSIRSEG